MPRVYTRKPKPVCTFPDCGRPRNSAIGLCGGHLLQQKAGKPLVPLRPQIKRRTPGTLPDIRYEEAPCPNPNLEGPCHIYIGTKKKGYCFVCFNGRNVLVHRYVWERDVGPIPPGMNCDHQCRIRSCCSVKHLRIVTPSINTLENIVGASWQKQATKTHCDNGHLFTDAGVKYVNGRKRRTCPECLRLACARYHAKKRLEKQLSTNDESSGTLAAT